VAARPRRKASVKSIIVGFVFSEMFTPCDFLNNWCTINPLLSTLRRTLEPGARHWQAPAAPAFFRKASMNGHHWIQGIDLALKVIPSIEARKSSFIDKLIDFELMRLWRFGK